MDDMTFLILRIVTTLIALIVACYVVPLLKQTFDRIEDKKLDSFIQAAVYAAQQTIKTCGEDKFAYVEKLTLGWLNDHGIEITQEQLKVLIESAVYAMKYRNEH